MQGLAFESLGLGNNGGWPLDTPDLKSKLRLEAEPEQQNLSSPVEASKPHASGG